jgi:hypothetical protein
MFCVTWRQHDPLPSSTTIRGIGLAFVLLTGASLGARGQDRQATYIVVGVTPVDPLNVRSGPGESYRIVATLQNGKRGVQITGPPVMNGNDDWVSIATPDVEGWVRPRYLERVWPVATLPDDSSSPATNAEPNLNSLRRTPTREPGKPSDLFEKKEPAPTVKRRPVTADSDSGFGWFVLMIIGLFFVVAAGKKGKKTPLSPNQCPKCGHETLETRRKFFGGSYRRCARWWCGYNEDKLQKAENQAKADSARAAQRRARWEAEEYERRQRIEDQRSAVLWEQQRQRERNEREAQDRERRGY